MKQKAHQPARFRLAFVYGLFVLSAICVSYRLVVLHLIENDFLKSQGDARAQRILPINTYRGMILDRNGDFLAISTPVKSLWVNPLKTDLSHPNWHKAAKILNLPQKQLIAKIKAKKTKHFMYLKRHMSPSVANKLIALKIPELHLQTEYRRFYPTGEVSAHVLGTTGLDHTGQEGLELALNNVLQGEAGQFQVVKDRMGRIVESLGSKIDPKKGQDVVLSLDSRIQYLAYKTILETQKKYAAKAASIVVLDVDTGEVLAMANVPSYNPNVKLSTINDSLRNRAVTDQFEPGSVIKPFSISYALQSGRYSPETEINTSPGWMSIGDKIVRDIRNYGKLSVSQIIKKSSNVGVTKLILSLPASGLYNTLEAVGFGQRTESGFPGESQGRIVDDGRNNPFSLATLAFGYGLTTTPLQLAKSYSILASGGILRPIRFIKHQAESVSEIRVMDEKVVAEVTKMLGMTTAKGGTALRARVPGYHIAGKTGTVRKVIESGYSNTEHVAIFAGFAPIENPKVVIAVVVDEPKGKYYGGIVAAPVFSTVMSGALRILNVPRDDYSLSSLIKSKLMAIDYETKRIT